MASLTEMRLLQTMRVHFQGFQSDCFTLRKYGWELQADRNMVDMRMSVALVNAHLKLVAFVNDNDLLNDWYTLNVKYITHASHSYFHTPVAYRMNYRPLSVDFEAAEHELKNAFSAHLPFSMVFKFD